MKERERNGGQAGVGGRGSLLAVIPAAMTYTVGMGKGLMEPCSPYRQAYVFGAPLNIPNADNWNCVPVIMDPTTSFDLSGIQPNHEVVVVLLVVYNIPAGASHNIRFKWYRDRDSKLLYDFSYTIPDPGQYGYPYWEWFYVYSYIGYFSSEIYESGNHHVDILWDGTLLQRIAFTISRVMKGTISKKELEYNGSRASIPASNIPQGKRGLVHIWGRNDMDTTQRMGIWWRITDPAGTVVEEYSIWEAVPYTSSGGAHEFIGGRFDLNKAGTYTIDVALYMSPAAPEIVARYTGTLCVVAVVELKITEFKILDYVKT